MIRLSRDNICKAFAALASIDYHPAILVTAEDFANPEIRESWRREKQMPVLKMWSDRHRETPVDIFVYELFDFQEEYERAFRFDEPETPSGALCFHSGIDWHETDGLPAIAILWILNICRKLRC